SWIYREKVDTDSTAPFRGKLCDLSFDVSVAFKSSSDQCRTGGSWLYESGAGGSSFCILGCGYAAPYKILRMAWRCGEGRFRHIPSIPQAGAGGGGRAAFQFA